MIGNPCHRCGSASPVEGRGRWCRHLNGPATGNGTICLETGDLLPAGPCRADCGHHGGGRGRRC